MDNVRLSNCIYINMTHGFENMKQAIKSDALSLKERIATFALGLFEIILLPGFGTALTYLDCKYLKTKVKEEPKQEEPNSAKGNFWTKAKACAVIAMCVIAPAVGFIAYNWFQPAPVNQPMCGLNEKPVNGTMVDNNVDCPNPDFQAPLTQLALAKEKVPANPAQAIEVQPVVAAATPAANTAIQPALNRYSFSGPQCTWKDSPAEIIKSLISFDNIFNHFRSVNEELKQELNATRGA